MRALVTGATGFVGAAVARALAQAGWSVRVLARAAPIAATYRHLPVEVAEGELAQRESLERALEGCNALFHVAADYRLGARDPDQLYRTNVEGTRNILQAARPPVSNARSTRAASRRSGSRRTAHRATSARRSRSAT
jgi:dihydroflavonol-4-reductase